MRRRLQQPYIDMMRHRAFRCQRMCDVRREPVLLNLRQIIGSLLHRDKIAAGENMIQHGPHLRQVRGTRITAKPLDHTLDLLSLTANQRSLQCGHLLTRNHRLSQPQKQTVSCPQKRADKPQIQRNRPWATSKKQACSRIRKQPDGRLRHRQPCRITDHQMLACLRQSGTAADHQPIGQRDHRLLELRNGYIHHVFSAKK